MDTMTLIVSIAALVAVAVVLSRVLTWVFKIVLLAAIVWFLVTQVDFLQVQNQLQKWTSQHQKSIKPFGDTIKRAARDRSVGL